MCNEITRLIYNTIEIIWVCVRLYYVMVRDPQISQLAKYLKTQTVRNMFLNQIKHINVDFDSRTTREFL